MKKKFVISIFITKFTIAFSFILFINPVLAETFKLSQEFKERTYIAILGVSLGFISSLILEKIKKKNEAHRQISYKKIIKADVIEFAHELKEQNENEEIEIKYNGRTVNNLAVIFLFLKNTGNRDIKQQYFRLQLPKKCEFRKDGYKIEPEPEMGFKEVKSNKLKHYEKAYEIDYIRPNQEIGLRFIIEVGKNEKININISWKNKSDNEVTHIPEELRQVENERDTIQKFLILCFFFLLIPSSYTSNSLLIITLFIKTIILGFIILLIPSITKIIVDFLIEKEKNNDSYIINVEGNSKANLIGIGSTSSTINTEIEYKEQEYNTDPNNLEKDLYKLLEIIKNSNLTTNIKEDISITLEQLVREVQRSTTRANKILFLCSELQDILNTLPFTSEPVQKTNLLLTKIRESLNS